MIHFRHDRARQSLPLARKVLQPRKLAVIVGEACARGGVAPSRFGRDAVGDPSLVADLAGGRQPRAATRAAILAHVDRITIAAEVRHG